MFAVLGPIRTVGRYRFPRTGGVLVLANHLSDIDPIVVQVACPRRIFFMAKSELFEMKGVGAFMRWYRAFPVQRGTADRSALKHAIELLKAGHVVCLFPEGELSESGELLPILPGATLISRQSQVPTICLGLRNTNRVIPYGKIIPRPAWRRILAVWGEPRTIEKSEDAEATAAWIDRELRRLTDQD